MYIKVNLSKISVMTEVTRKDIEFLFQEEVLNDHGQYLLNLFYDTIKQKKIRKDDVLYNSLQYDVERKGKNYILNIIFETYGRYIEIRSHKKNKITVDTNKLLWGSRHKNKPKNVDWYSKNAYGSLNRLISRIMYELTDSEFERLKSILENR